MRKLKLSEINKLSRNYVIIKKEPESQFFPIAKPMFGYHST